MSAKTWSSKVGWFNDNYALRVLKATFGPSSKGSPMITLELEVATPESANINGQEYTVAGVKLKHYITTQSMRGGVVDAEKTTKMADRIEATFKAFGIPFENFDANNPDVSAFEGKVIWAFVKADVDEKRKSPTPEQVAAGQPGDIAINPVTGEKIQNYWPKVDEFFGLANL